MPEIPFRMFVALLHLVWPPPLTTMEAKYGECWRCLTCVSIAYGVYPTHKASGLISLSFFTPSQGIFIQLVQANSPAALAGLRFGDQVLQINGQNCAGWSTDKAHKALKSAAETRIELIVRDRSVSSCKYERVQLAEKGEKRNLKKVMEVHLGRPILSTSEINLFAWYKTIYCLHLFLSKSYMCTARDFIDHFRPFRFQIHLHHVH